MDRGVEDGDMIRTCLTCGHQWDSKLYPMWKLPTCSYDHGWWIDQAWRTAR